ncbi:phosphatidylglycerophosphate synthase [Bellilinea caldifistulae]|uniref:CDP-alcohol phosphatidyltransferase family protein n=1 Tax=Bellilinea caldifistulae TaxID=360411 RepID=UPI000782F7A4|nr:CDP-alcohol phosphatidyltransferase family protein [Bellilinea caldifistulae]GAP10122.1 phosphatidylglycerophosphate synthase [Bellilinea caldifistulae]
MVRTEKQPQKGTFTDFLRARFKGVLDPIGAFLIRLGLTPNWVTLLGLVGIGVSAVFLARGQFFWGGVVVLIMAPLDALDGTMARLIGNPTRFGGVLDSVVDRFAEIILIGGLVFYYLQQNEWLPVFLGYAAAGGSLMVSYVKARAEAARFVVKGGLLTRVERFLVLIPLLILGQPLLALWILAVLGNFTALQRLWLVYQQSRKEEDLPKV